jgi:hypothetical protein
MRNLKPKIEELHLMHKQNYLRLKNEFNLAYNQAVYDNNLEDMNHYKKRMEELEIDFESTQNNL